MRELNIAVIAAASGILWAFCFGRESSLWLGWVALAPLLVLIGHPRLTTRRAALAGLVHGTAFWLVSVHWIPPTIRTFGHLPPALAWFLLVLLSLFLALYQALFAAVGRRLLRRPVKGGGGLWQLGGWCFAVVALPAVWVVIEWLRGSWPGFLGFPWNLACYAWVDVPGVLPLAAWIGPWGISYLVLAANAAVALAWRDRRLLPATVTVLAVLLLLALAGRFSHGEEEPFGDGGQAVRLVQPNQTLEPADAAVVRRQYEQIMMQSRSECRGDPVLLVWPESAAWPYTWHASWELRRDLRQLAAQGCAVIFNTPTADDSRPGANAYFNSALLVSATVPGSGGGTTAGPTGRYNKRFLVPWGEHVPLADVLPFVGKLARFAGRFSAGRSPALLEWRGERLGMAICYEAVFPQAAVEQVRAGATLLVNVSNDAWYGDTSAPRQLFRAARFRAAENRRPMLRAALTGISGVIGRRGEVLKRLELGDRGVLRARVPGAADLSPYARFPFLVPLACAALAILAIFQGRRTTRDDHTRDR